MLAADTNAETTGKALTAPRVALRVRAGNGLIEADPCAGVRVPRSDEQVEEELRGSCTPAECTAIILAAEGDGRPARTSRWAVRSLASRSAAACAPGSCWPWSGAWAAFDLDAARVRVRRSLDRKPGPDGRPAFVTPKSRSSRRDVPLPALEVARLRRHRMASGRPPDGALVFATALGDPLNSTGVVRYAWRKAVEASGVSRPFPKLHDARHAYATHALRAGLTMHAVARLLGHRDVALIARRYGHALPDELAEAGNMLERFRESWSA